MAAVTIPGYLDTEIARHYHEWSHKEVSRVDKPIKSMTLRLPADQAAELERVAEVDQVPVSEAVREAITRHIEARRQDGEFRERLERMLRENQEILERLAR